MAHIIDSSTCICCGACAAECPVDAISQGNGSYMINPALCIDCAECVVVCPVECISLKEQS